MYEYNVKKKTQFLIISIHNALFVIYYAYFTRIIRKEDTHHTLIIQVQ